MGPISFQMFNNKVNQSDWHPLPHHVACKQTARGQVHAQFSSRFLTLPVFTIHWINNYPMHCLQTIDSKSSDLWNRYNWCASPYDQMEAAESHDLSSAICSQMRLVQIWSRSVAVFTWTLFSPSDWNQSLWRRCDLIGSGVYMMCPDSEHAPI